MHMSVRRTDLAPRALERTAWDDVGHGYGPGHTARVPPPVPPTPQPGGRDQPGDGPLFKWTLKRNCSATPRQLGAALTALGAVTLFVAVLFAEALNAWPVLPFAALHVGGLGIAFFAYARHAIDRETITLYPAFVVIEVGDGPRCTAYRFNRDWVRVVIDGDVKPTVFICGAGQRVEVGRHLASAARRQLAAELRRAIREL
jgi:uncharacterized membrane protein